ncbi:hypothetical protein TNCV_187571 [Trichonephila clavipes]|nr:hypothetical protein TNCV_187571 [Trichonephila clavipes]
MAVIVEVKTGSHSYEVIICRKLKEQELKATFSGSTFFGRMRYTSRYMEISTPRILLRLYHTRMSRNNSSHFRTTVSSSCEDETMS